MSIDRCKNAMTIIESLLVEGERAAGAEQETSDGAYVVEVTTATAERAKALRRAVVSGLLKEGLGLHDSATIEEGPAGVYVLTVSAAVGGVRGGPEIKLPER